MDILNYQNFGCFYSLLLLEQKYCQSIRFNNSRINLKIFKKIKEDKDPKENNVQWCSNPISYYHAIRVNI